MLDPTDGVPGRSSHDRSARRLSLSLLPRIAARDEQAFASLYDACSPAAYGLLLRMLGDPAAAQQLLETTFSTIWDQAPELGQSASSDLGCVLVTARNLAIRTPRETRQERVNASRGDSAEIEEPSEIRMERRRVRSALAELPPQERELAERYCFEGAGNLRDAAGAPSEMRRRAGEILRKLRRRLDSAGRRRENRNDSAQSSVMERV